MSVLSVSQLYEFLGGHRYGVVSSRAADGAPQSALVGIAVSPTLEVYFDTTGETRKAANLRRDPRAALVIGWENEQSVQYEGVADEPQGGELAALKSIYYLAWPDGPSREAWTGITWFRIRPRWIRFSDFNRASGAVREMTF
ncbi:MAG TPA: pyridoxamine 5'-phosphate oxidase family protein [Rhizomicrobium sp.]|nr:pyridoxamine 5'-phosphate oxidase family protein [Rhizomicrobium sp.]